MSGSLMKCPKCEKEISFDNNFCDHCGHEITNEERKKDIIDTIEKTLREVKNR